MVAVDMTREKQLNLRLSGDEFDRFEKVAEHHGITIAALIRMLVKREAENVLKPANARDAVLAAIERFRTKVSGQAPIPERYIDHVVVMEGKVDPFEKEFAIETLLRDGKIRKTKADGELAFWREGEGPKR